MELFNSNSEETKIYTAPRPQDTVTENTQFSREKQTCFWEGTGINQGSKNTKTIQNPVVFLHIWYLGKSTNGKNPTSRSLLMEFYVPLLGFAWPRYLEKDTHINQIHGGLMVIYQATM